MRDIIFLMVISVCLAASCPDMCNGHGSCTMSGTCSCYKGYTYGDCSGKTCPFGKTYVEPSADSENTGDSGKVDVHTDLECSGKGNCNRNSGLCECYDGFEGSACQRLSCPNSCSGHGLCVPVKHLSLNSNEGYQSIYDNAKVNTNDEYQKVRYDADQSYACVCDSEYSGYDCSEKKCPSGYMATSSCAQSSSTATVTIEFDKTPSDGSTNSAGCLAYLEYTDNNGKKWYSDKFCVGKENKDSSGGSGLLSWTEALQRLPVGVIDLETTVTCDTTDKCKTVTITFGNQQTGRKHQIKVITKKDLTDDKNKLYPGADNASGYHGMSVNDIPDNDNNNPNTAYVAEAQYPQYSYGGVAATECAGNGLCNSESGLCECFTGFYGIACTMTEDMM